MRLFVAIDLPDIARDHIRRLVGKLSKPHINVHVSWTKPENWHITLKFLGEVEEARVAQLTSTLGEIRFESMNLCADRMTFFPRRGPVHVVSVGVGAEVGRVEHLYESVETACENLRFSREKREYTPHITIGRSKLGYAQIRQKEMAEEFPGPMFRASEFVLYRSELTSRGSIYTRLATFPKT